MKQRNGKVLCAAHGCSRLATVRLVPPRRTSGRELSPMYYCATHARSVPTEKSVAFAHGFTVMMDLSVYFKDVVEES
jgi:hypothetical protein